MHACLIPVAYACMHPSPPAMTHQASNLTTNVTEIKAGSMMAGCPGSPVLPAAYGASAHVMVDWTFGKTCTDPCGCAPTDYHDCQQSTPLPAGAPYTKDCQRVRLPGLSGLSTATTSPELPPPCLALALIFRTPNQPPGLPQ